MTILAQGAEANPFPFSGSQLRPNPIAKIEGAFTAIDNSALTVDFGGPQQTPLNHQYWILRWASVKGWTVNALNVNPPVSGLFIIKAGEPPDSLGDGQSVLTPAPGVPLYRRGTSIGSSIIASPGASGSFFQCLMNQGQPIILPGEMLRFVGMSQPGTAAPGPGAGSWAQVTAYVEIISLIYGR